MALMNRAFAALLLLTAQCLAQPGAAQPPLRFGVIGDSGTGGSGQRRVAGQMAKANEGKHWEFVLMLGDNIYETGKPSDFDRKFKRIYRPLMEAGPIADGRRLARFLTINSEAWIDSIEQGNEGDLKYRMDRFKAWLDNAADYRWNILFLHHPLYSYTQQPLLGFISRGHGPEDELREVLEPSLIGKVDIVLAGHEHFFQKMLPQKGVHYIVSGGGGKVRKGAVRDHDQVEFAQSTLHFLDVSLDSNAFRYRAIDSRGAEVYAGEILKPAQPGEKKSAPKGREPTRTQ